MKEFAQSFLGDNFNTTRHLHERLNESYEAADTAKQYLELYTNIVKGGFGTNPQQSMPVSSQQPGAINIASLPDLR